MQETVQLVSKMKSNNLCKPCEGYSESAQVDLSEYKEVGEIEVDSLPICDEAWPKGAPINLVIFKNKIFEKNG